MLISCLPPLDKHETHPAPGTGCARSGADVTPGAGFRRSLGGIALLGILVVTGCATGSPPAATAGSTAAALPREYLAAVERARSDELAPAPRLVDIRPGNRALTFNRRGTAVLVATLTSAREFPDGPGKRVTIPTDVWVTPVPQVRRVCRSYVSTGGADPLLRMEQYLGLPPDPTLDQVVTFQAPIRRLFRPTPDPRIDTRRVSLDPGAPPRRLNGFGTFPHWYREQRATADATGLPYPWTGRGYTFDWGNPADPVGGSEFVVRANTSVTVTSRLDPAAYCAATDRALASATGRDRASWSRSHRLIGNP